MPTTFLRGLNLTTGVIGLTAFLREPNPQGRFIVHEFFEELGPDLDGWVDARVQQQADVYFRVTTLLNKPTHGRGRKSATAAAPFLWVDLDPPYADLERLKQFRPRPTYIVSSGNGLHAYWLLTAPLTDIAEIESRTRWLSQQLHGDKCWTVTQILRIPGTMNFKNVDSPRPVEIVASAPQLQYDPSSFGVVEAPPLEDLPTQLEEAPLPSTFLDSLTADLRNRIMTGRGAPIKRDGQPDRSENDWFVVNALLERGWEPGQCLTVLTKTDWFSSSKTRELGARYAIDTVLGALKHQKARTNVDLELPNCLQNPIELATTYTDDKGQLHARRLLNGGELVEPVVSHLKAHGARLVWDDRSELGYLALPTGRMFELTPNPDFTAWLTRASGYTDVETNHRILRAGLATAAIAEGAHIRPAPWCDLDPSTRRFYMLTDTTGRKMLRVATDDEIQEVPNGTDGVMLFPSAVSRAPVDFDATADPTKTFSELVNLFVGYLACSQVNRELLTAYLLSIPLASGFTETIQTFPVLHLRGPSGGGKSQTLRMISTLLNGGPTLLNSTVAAGYRLAYRELLLPYDDYEVLDPEVKQFILTGSTGVMRQMSGQGSRATVKQMVHIFIALTSIGEIEQESLRRRALQIEIGHGLYPTREFWEGHWIKLQSLRSQLWSAYCLWLRETLLPKLTKERLQALAFKATKMITVSTFQGVAPFLALAAIVFSEFNKLVGMSRHATPEALLPHWLQALSFAEDALLGDSRPLLQAIHATFEAYDRRSLFTRVLVDGGRVESTFRDQDYRLTPVDAPEGPTLQGTTTEWLVTINTACRSFLKVESAKSLGWMFRDLVAASGHSPSVGQTVEMWGYGFTHVKIGPRMGWKITRFR